MMRWFKARSDELGHLESTVMEALWRQGAGNVRDVGARLGRPLAYTTVMTTLDRLFKKGLLDRRKQDRAFVYSPRYSRTQWQRKRAGEFMAGYLTGPETSRDLLISCLVDAAGEQDSALLDKLEQKIRRKRQELSRGRQS
ncbi:MAG: BlaI/MecI/CopY family transcriptional regulator [Bryobacteraceae bacterium]|jgi:predicted transcriptional regulator